MSEGPHPRLMQRLERVQRDRAERFLREECAVLRAVAAKLDHVARVTGDADMRKLTAAAVGLGNALDALGQHQQHFMAFSSDVKRTVDQLNTALKEWHCQWKAGLRKSKAAADPPGLHEACVPIHDR